ncbi:unnamed protein product [Rotaria sp. Silwood2]|nr:unnamed protein product [Rotaria sp. Silwood2]CAF4357144.1 unnamed protein product [Rotaria sp. Silwood2]CAF4384356.1 unnamed protein product [Rotaria sp. Silwood2]CAF4405065.1 unnamed protein product [Rotaria sp. Silwood2]
MECKLSRESLIELQLIPPKSTNNDALCPCCKQRVAEHRNGRRIGRIPFTRYNICPRMRRICRKTSVVGIVVGAVVAFVIFLLSSTISYLIAIRSEEDKNLANYMIAYRKNLSSINYLPNTDKSFTASCLLEFVKIHRSFKKSKKRDGQQHIPIPVTRRISATTQTTMN